MAVTRETQKDIGSYEAKFMGPFTARQSIFFVAGAVISVMGGYTAFSAGADILTIFIIVAVIMAPFILFGWKKIYGMKMEDFLISFYFYHYKAPAIRKYEIVSDLDKIKDEKPLDKKNRKQITHKENPEIPSYK